MAWIGRSAAFSNPRFASGVFSGSDWSGEESILYGASIVAKRSVCGIHSRELRDAIAFRYTRRSSLTLLEGQLLNINVIECPCHL